MEKRNTDMDTWPQSRFLGQSKMATCKRCKELEEANNLILSKLAAIERLTVPKEKQLIQFAEDAVDDTMPWDNPVKAKKSPLAEGDESLDRFVPPKPGDAEVPF